MAARAWLIVLDLDSGAEPNIHATVDDHVLLPRKRYRHPIEALEYVDHVLADFKPGDDITLLALNVPAPFASWSTRCRSVAIQWCAIVLARDSYGGARKERPGERDFS